MNSGGLKELTESVLASSRCSVCGACVGMCPYLKIQNGRVAVLFDCDLKNGRCFWNCPQTGLGDDRLTTLFPQDSETELGSYLEIAAAKAGPSMPDRMYQNGGTVSALLTVAMAEEIISGAILTGSEGLRSRPVMIANGDSARDYAGTRYVMSPVVSTLNEAINEKRSNLGIVGTPCQLRGVAQARSNPLNPEDFIDPVGLTIGLFCTWSLDYRRLHDYLKGRIDSSRIVKMDVPPPPSNALNLNTEERKYSFPLDEVKNALTDGCSTCQDLTARWSDISVGAFEGRPGWNTLIARTDKGTDLVRKAVEKGYLVLDEFPERNLENLKTAAKLKQNRVKPEVTG